MHILTRVSVTFLMVGETNSTVGFHLMTEGHSIQPGSGGTVSPATGPEQHCNNNKNIQINNNNNNNKNNNNNLPETRKYWVDNQRGIASSHGERDPL